MPKFSRAGERRGTINGETVARPHTAGSRFGLGDMLPHASASEQLVHGEMFSIGALAADSGMEISRGLGQVDRHGLLNPTGVTGKTCGGSPAGQRRKPEPVRMIPPQATGELTAQHLVLMTQHEQFGIPRKTRPDQDCQQAEQAPQQAVDK